MENKVLKTILISLIFIMLFFVCNQYSFAEEQTGKVNFEAIESGTKNSIPSLQVKIYKIGIKNEVGDFEYSQGFEASNAVVDDFTESNINNIKTYAEKNATPAYIKTTDSNGKFVIENLPIGAYLFVQDSMQDKYTMQTMLVAVPEVNQNREINYEFIAKPKVIVVSEKITEQPVVQSTSTAVVASSLPYTGALNWPIPVLAITGIIIFSIGWLKFYTNSKKK